MVEVYRYNEIMEKAEGYFVVCRIVERDVLSKEAKGFVIYSKQSSKHSAQRDLEYYQSKGFDMVMIPAFPDINKAFQIIYDKGKFSQAEPLVKPEEIARFFRSYYFPPEE